VERGEEPGSRKKKKVGFESFIGGKKRGEKRRGERLSFSHPPREKIEKNRFGGEGENGQTEIMLSRSYVGEKGDRGGFLSSHMEEKKRWTWKKIVPSIHGANIA